MAQTQVNTENQKQYDIMINNDARKQLVRFENKQSIEAIKKRLQKKFPYNDGINYAFLNK